MSRLHLLLEQHGVVLNEFCGNIPVSDKTPALSALIVDRATTQQRHDSLGGSGSSLERLHSKTSSGPFGLKGWVVDLFIMGTSGLSTVTGVGGSDGSF